MKTERRKTVFGYTLGCRLNSYETDALVDKTAELLDGEVVHSAEKADWIIVNTCAVTGRSQARSRKTVRTYLARYPEAGIVVTGCVAEVAPEDFTGMDPARVTVVPNTGKHLVPQIISGITEEQKSGLFPITAPLSSSKTRAFLKIQDGCSNRCTYCIVPLARGNSRSQPRELILEQARNLVKAGYREICLTGVDIADYGSGLYGDYGLPELMEDLLAQGGFRLRVGSIEPLYLTVKTLEKMAIHGVCRHFHIPFQSGSDRTLSRMGRKYGRAEENELLSALEELFPGVCTGSDVIAGFPGESDADFHESLELAEDGRINYLHVFPYSPRPGTPAAKMKPVHTETITHRAETLRGISVRSRNLYRQNMIGTEQTVLVESRRVNGRQIGLTDNYIPVYTPDGSVEGELVSVTLSRDNIVWEQR